MTAPSSVKLCDEVNICEYQLSWAFDLQIHCDDDSVAAVYHGPAGDQVSGAEADTWHPGDG